MKNGLVLAIVILILGTLYLDRVRIEQAVYNFLYYSPCDTPITWSIGSVDPKFGISRDRLLSDSQEAQDIWNNADHKTLLQYDPNSQFTISLVYDVRQRLNSQINNLNSSLQQEDQSLKPEIAQYEQDVANFKAKVAQLNNDIDEWNKKGGAPPDVYKSLIERQQALQQDAQKLNEEARTLNQSTEQYNTEVNQLNQKVNTFNNVLEFKPEEGLYTQDSTGKKIEIYFYSSKQDLVHTLAHEMGHSIGLSHINNQDAIMFPQTNDVTQPSQDDLSALSKACEKRNIFVELANRIIFKFKQ